MQKRSSASHWIRNSASRSARDVYGYSRPLQWHPDQLRELTRFRQAVDEIPAFGIRVLPITAGLVSVAADAADPDAAGPLPACLVGERVSLAS
jgi:hypothetical protein